MAARTSQGAKLLFGLKRGSAYEKLKIQLPEAYQQFWNEWKNMKPTSVHSVPDQKKWTRNEMTETVSPIQNVEIPVFFPKEQNEGIWGGEGVVKGFQKRHPQKRRVPHFWVPVLRRSVVRSNILDKFFSVTVTDRTLELIHENHGFDHYILKTPACDLKSMLALKLKRNILQTLETGCPNLEYNPVQQANVLKEYIHYLQNYTPEQIEWYGLSYFEAIEKMDKENKKNNPKIALKTEYRKNLIEKLQEKGGLSAEENEFSDNSQTNTTWLSKVNPFSTNKSS